jgi:hypothetical protein
MKLIRKKEEFSRHRRQPLNTGERPKSSLTYYSRRSDEDLNIGRKLQRKVQERASRSKRVIRIHRSILLLAGIAIVILMINFLSLSTDVVVMPESTDLSGIFDSNRTSYQQSAQKLLSESVWNHNKLTVNTNKVEQQLMAEYPEMTDVSIALPILGHQPVAYIQIAQPILILNDSHGSYVIDNLGKVLISNDSATSFSALHLPTVTDQSGLVLNRNVQALPSEDITFIQTIIAQLSARGLTVATMSLPAATSELDVQIKSESYYVKFNLESDDARQQVGTLLATQAYLATQNVTPTKYIDVRLDGRAYYL